MRFNPSNSVSPSQLDTMDCRLRWHWQYRLGYRSLRVSESLALGTGVHLGLEVYYGHKGDPVAAFTKWADAEVARLDPRWPDDIVKMQEIRRLGAAMLEGYVEYYKGKDHFDVIATEHTIMRNIPDPRSGEPSPYHLTVRLDGVIRDHVTGRLMSLEHKTYKRFDDSHFDKDHQFTLQVEAGQALVESGLKGIDKDEEIIGVLYNGLRSQMPGPRVSSPLFERHFIERNEHQRKVMMHRAFWQKHEFAQRGFVIYPQPSAMKCGRCDFSGSGGPCAAYQRGEDYQLILDSTFSRRGQQDRIAQQRQEATALAESVKGGPAADEPTSESNGTGVVQRASLKARLGV